MRSASSASIMPRGHDQLLGAAEPDDGRQARGAADVGDDPELDLGQAELRRRWRRSAGRSRAPPPARRRRRCGGSGRRPAWPSLRRGWRTRGTLCGTGAACPGWPAEDISSTRSTPAENTGPSPRRTTQCTPGSAAASRSAVAERAQQLLVHRVALLGAVQDDVADGAAVLGVDDAHGRPPRVRLATQGYASRARSGPCRTGRHAPARTRPPARGQIVSRPSTERAGPEGRWRRSRRWECWERG